MTTLYWLGELNQHGYPDLKDGPYDTIAGVEKAAYLHNALFPGTGAMFPGTGTRVFVLVTVTHEPVVAKKHDVNMGAVRDCQKLLSRQ